MKNEVGVEGVEGMADQDCYVTDAIFVAPQRYVVPPIFVAPQIYGFKTTE